MQLRQQHTERHTPSSQTNTPWDESLLHQLFPFEYAANTYGREGG